MSPRAGRLLDAATVVLVAALAGRSVRAALVRPPWRDEEVSAWFARMSWPDFWHRLHLLDAVMTPYYLLLRALPHSLLAYRLVSVLAMVAAVGCAVGLARRLAGRSLAPVAGLVTAAVCLHNHYLLFYAAQARGYALATFGVAALALVLARPQPRWAPALVVVAVVGHLFAALPVAVLLLGHRVRDWRPWTALALTAGPLAVAGRHQTALVAWIGELFGDQTLRSVHLTTSAPVYLAAAAVVAGVLGRRFGLLAWWLGPLACLETLTLLGHPLLYPRYVVESAPAFAVLAGCAGADVLRRLRPTYARDTLLTGSAQELPRHRAAAQTTITP